ncbi:hypothetical protein B0T22DRAFT_478404 [Podospora appendiculata]|uniref:Uncharacterized protein n=1 Tax=Podospora appendiculata TaxID=314037 RepID=A0AAE0XLT4_9PEZI|nr:hypothetical protein B0T22DRAFT_478404 [Podospora appendiculata]
MHSPVILLFILTDLLGFAIAAQLPQGYTPLNRNITHLRNTDFFISPPARQDPHGSNYPFSSSRVWDAKLPSTLTSKNPSVPTETDEDSASYKTESEMPQPHPHESEPDNVMKSGRSAAEANMASSAPGTGRSGTYKGADYYEPESVPDTGADMNEIPPKSAVETSRNLGGE